MDWLNECMEPMAKQVSAHGGVIEQFTGDAIVAVFGVPIARKTKKKSAKMRSTPSTARWRWRQLSGPQSPLACSESAHDSNADRHLYGADGCR